MDGSTLLYLLACLVTFAVALLVAGIAWRRRAAPGSGPFGLLIAAIALWVLFRSFESLAPNLETRILWAKLEYIGIANVAPLWLVFTLDHTRTVRQFSRPWLLALWIVPVVTIALAFTNEWHRLLWPSVSLVPGDPGRAIFEHGLWFWIAVAFNYSALAAGLAVLARAMIRQPHEYGRTGLALSLGLLIPWAANAAYVSGLLVLPFDFTPLGFIATVLLSAWAVFQRRLFDLLPVAGEEMLDSMTDAVLIADAQNQIVHANQPARLYLGLADTAPLQGWPTPLQPFAASSQIQAEIRTGEGRVLDLRISPLSEPGGRRVGKLIVLRDVSALHTTTTQLQRLKEFHESIVQRLTEGIAIEDGQGRFVFINPAGADLLGYTVDELIGQHWTTIIAPEHWHRVEAADQRRARGESDRYEVDLLRKDGRRVPVLVSGSPRLDPATGQPGGSLAVFTEITERKLAEEALRQQTQQLETLNRISQALTASLDLSRVLETILHELQNVVPYDSAAIFETNGEYLELLSGRGFPNYSDLRGARFSIHDPDSPTTVVFQTNAPYIVDDAPQVYPRFGQPPYNESRTRGWLGVPLLYGSRQIGLLTLDKREPRFYTAQHARLAEAFASQAAIAIKNARLFETERAARVQAEALQAATAALSMSLDLSKVLDAILVELQRVVPFDSAAVHQIRGSQRAVIAGRGFDDVAALIGLTFNLTPAEDAVGYAIMQSRKPLIIDDVLIQYPDFNDGPHAQAAARGWLGVPMLFGDKLIGLISLDKRQPGFYTEAHGRVALAYATQAAIAIENASLFAAVTEALRREQHLKDAASILSASLDLPTTLQNFVRVATELVGAQAGVLAMRSLAGEGVEYPARHNVPDSLQIEAQARADSLMWRVIERGQSVLAADSDPHRRLPADWEAAGVHGFMGVPITAGSETIGALGLFDFDSATLFDRPRLALAEAIGKQASIAIQNARHFENERRHALRQAALFRLSTELAAARDEADIWHRVVNGLFDEQLGYELLIVAEREAATGDRTLRAARPALPPLAPDRLPAGRGLSDRPLHSGRTHYTPDVTLAPDYEPGFPGGSEADVPIFIDDEPVGVLIIQNQRPNAFSPADLAVFEAAARQAGLALGRARLLRETRQRLTELATINAISQAAASQRRPAALLEIVGEQVRRAFDVQAVFIALIDRAANLIRIPYWKYLDQRMDTLTLKFGEGLTSVIIETRQPLLINENYEKRAAELGAVPVVARLIGKHALSWLGVPIMVGEEPIGVISAQNFERENVFTESDVRLLTTIAANIGIAVRNVQLYSASEQRAAELNAALQSSRTLTSSLDLTTVLDAILDSVFRLQSEIESVDLFLYRDDSLVFGSSAFGSGARKDRPYQPPRPDGITYTVARSGEPIIIEDIEKEPRFHAPGWVGAILSQPLKIAGRVVGVMNVAYAQPRTYGDSELRVLRLLADQAAIAIENARLYEESRKELRERARAEEQLRQANERLQAHIAEIEALQSQLREQAVRDPLTGLFNRRYLEETLDRELSRAERYNVPVSIVMIDIDHFKAVNDSHGHKAGDLILQALGHLLLTHTRRGDIACRYGGEEFIIIMPGASDDIAVRRANLWRAAFEQINVGGAHRPVQATLSIGVAMFPRHGRTADEILRSADLALYASKAAGRNRVVVFEPPP